MKFFSVSLVLAAVGSVVSAVPAAADTTDVDMFAHLQAIAAAAGPENGQHQCATTKKSGTVANAENIVNYLRSLPHTQQCVTNQRNNGHWIAFYQINGDTEFVGAVSNGNCSQATLNCHTLSDYFQNLINTCKLNGRVEAARYLNPGQFEFTNPKLCKKTDTDFIIGILPHSSS